jgi:glycosyltransferase involved in cell wall biosynthesis
MGKPKLSVLLSAFNAAEYIREAIESILNQTFGDFELLIADDGSADQTKDIIDSFCSDARVRASHNVTNRGKTNTINRLFGLSKGDYITIHDADDISILTRFSTQMGLLLKNPKWVMCGCEFESFTSFGFSEVNGLESDYDVIKEQILVSSQFHGPTMIFKKKVIRSNLRGQLLRAFYDDYNEDCDLAIRLTEVGICTNVNEVLYRYRIRPNSLSKTLTPRKKSLYHLLVQLHYQRLKDGVDSLQKGEIETCEHLVQSLESTNYADRSKIHRESAEFLMYYGLKSNAIISGWKAVWVAPHKLINWGTLQYCVRSYLFK